MFPGGGTQRVRMGQQLYRSEPIYREAFDRCAGLFFQHLAESLTEAVFPTADGEASATKRLLKPSLNMASIFATEYALTELLSAFGVRPAMVIGHSLGEYTAAWLAGVLSLEDAVTLVALRGQLSDGMPASAMLSVNLPESTVLARLHVGLSLAAVNSREHCVVSGEAQSIAALRTELEQEGVHCQQIPIAMAPHSTLVEPFADKLSARAKSMTLRPPSIPLVSNLTGAILGATEARDPTHWGRHLRQTVRFTDGLTTILAQPDTLLLEVGPGKTLSTLAQLHPHVNGRAILTCMAHAGSGRTELEALLFALGQLWCMGSTVDLAALHRSESRRRVPLPTYPFQRHSYLLAPTQNQTTDSLSERLTISRPAQPVEQTAPQAAAMPVRNGMYGALIKIWEEVLGVQGITDGDNFFDMGGSSIVAVQLRALLAKRLGIALPMHALLEHPKLGELAQHLESLVAQACQSAAPSAAAPSASLLVRLHQGTKTQDPLFLVQPIGGTVFTYQPLAKQLGGRHSVYGLRASGMEPGERIFTDVAEMAARYIEEMRTVQPSGPYLLGGHSSGGVIAYEIARQLLAQGAPVRAVIMFDTISIEQTRSTKFLEPDDVLMFFAPFARLAPNAWQSFCSALAQDSSFREIILATNQAIAAYQPTEISAPLLFFRAQQRDPVLEHHPELGWVGLSGGGFVLRHVAGNHLNMMEDPYAARLAELISKELRRQSVRLEPQVILNEIQ